MALCQPAGTGNSRAGQADDVRYANTTAAKAAINADSQGGAAIKDAVMRQDLRVIATRAQRRAIGEARRRMPP